MPVAVDTRRPWAVKRTGQEETVPERVWLEEYLHRGEGAG